MKILTSRDGSNFTMWTEFARLNRTLAQRARKRHLFYAVAVYLATAFVAAYWIFILANPDLPATPAHEIGIQFGVGAAILLFFDLFFVLSRYQKRALVEPFHFRLFPLGSARITQYLLTSIAADKKTIMYVATAASFAVFFAVAGLPHALLLSCILVSLFAASIAVCTAVTAYLASRYFPGLRQGLVALLPLLALAFNVVVVTNSYHLIMKIPLVGSFGAAMEATYAGRYGDAVPALMVLTIALAAGILALHAGGLRTSVAEKES